MELTAYEQQARREVEQWKALPKRKALTAKLTGKVFDHVSVPAPLVQALGQAAQTTLHGVNAAAQATQRSAGIERELRGLRADAEGDGHRLELKAVDGLVRPLRRKYVAMAAAEGAAAGSLPALAGAGVVAAQSAALVADVAFLLGLSLRAAGEHLAYYGADLRRPEEQLYALQVLALSLGPDDTAKAAILNNLSKLSQQIARRATNTVLNQHALVKLSRQLASRLGIRLTQRKLAQLVPVAGGVVGASINAAFVNKVAETAYMLGRDRFLTQVADDPIAPDDAAFEDLLGEVSATIDREGATPMPRCARVADHPSATSARAAR